MLLPRSPLRRPPAPGAVVGVRTPQGTWTKAYGKADPKAGTLMTVGVHTRIGSVTKTFTGTVLMQLTHRGKLSLDDTIGRYVAGVPTAKRSRCANSRT